jgi:translation initiation factor eIF-2B subunit delta
MDAKAHAIVQTVREDHEAGAAQLAARALALLQVWLRQGPVSAAELEALLQALTEARPSMVPLANAVARCRRQLDWDHDGQQLSAQATHVVTAVLEQLQQANDRVARNACTLVPKGASILTHSRSSQVLALFRLLAERRHPFSVICTQSSPGNEGFTLARELDQLGVQVTLITDAQAGLFMAEADLVLSGCDSWLPDRRFINKSGTYLVALAARDQRKPCWVLADSFKESPHTRQAVTLEEMAPEELGAPAGARIRARNIYFETVPVRLISGRVSELGVFPCSPEPEP